MNVLAGPLHIVCCVLAVAGVAKITSPDAMRRSLFALGVVVPAWLIRALGAGEIGLAAATVGFGGVVLPVSVGLLHLGFVAVSILNLGSGAGGSCGCFGSADTPPSLLHVIANVVSAGVAFGALGVDGILDVIGAQPASGSAYVLLVLTGTGATLLVLTRLPALSAGPSAGPSSPAPFRIGPT